MTTPHRSVSSSVTLSAARWRRSSHSTAANNCVETAQLPAGLLAVRDSKDKLGPALVFAAPAWVEFLTALLDGGLGPG